MNKDLRFTVIGEKKKIPLSLSLLSVSLPLAQAPAFTAARAPPPRRSILGWCKL